MVESIRRRFLSLGAILLFGISGLLFLIGDEQNRAQITSLTEKESLMAAALKIEIAAMRNWQQKGGLKANLAYGHSGEEVRLAQHALILDTGVLNRSDATGYYGSKTQEAVKTFQQKYGIPPSGDIDPKTREQINYIYFNELCPATPEKQFDDYSFVSLGTGIRLPMGYTPNDLVLISDKIKTFGVACLKKDASSSLVEMFKEAEKNNIFLGVNSSFRREEVQDILYRFWTAYNYDDNRGKIAKPGHSEHQLGTAVDISGKSSGYKGADPAFGDSIEGKWIEENAHRFGFIQSYPRDKKDITGYDYEPWHYRWVGSNIAQEIKKEGITYTEYSNKKR